MKPNYEKDGNITNFGKAILKDRYLSFNEKSPQDLFARISNYYGDNEEHSQRLYEYISNLWFMPATPILSNGGTERGLPISCFLNEVQDNLEDIASVWNENVFLASSGGGIGTYWGNVRSMHDNVSDRGKSSGIIPFIKVQDSMTLAISQGSLRRGSAAVYLPIWHPEVEEFLEIRKPTSHYGGNQNRKSQNINNAIVIDDKFMNALKEKTDYELISPLDGRVVKKIPALELWVKILSTRMETGEPYVIYIDNVNRTAPIHHKYLGLDIKTSNLCSEIMLPTNKERTAVCCLSSVNLEYYDEWKNNSLFIEDVMRFLDNVLEDFIQKAPESMSKAKFSSIMARSVGLGVMGYHSYCQKNLIPFEESEDLNKEIFAHISTQCDLANKKLGQEKGACPDWNEYIARSAESKEIKHRFSHCIAIAPTANISIIGGECSPGIEPYNSNLYVQDTLTGSFTVTNKHLKKYLENGNFQTDLIYSSIRKNNGSIKQITSIDPHIRNVFKTAFEIDQYKLIQLASDRTPYIDQAQSLNIFVEPTIEKKDLHKLHFDAWKMGIKSMYYLRTKSTGRATLEYQEEDCEACQ